MPHRSGRALAALALAVLLRPAAATGAPAVPQTSAATVAPFGADELATLKRVAAAAAHSGVAYAEDAYLSDVIGPRLSGSLQDAAAVDYVASRMRALGLAVRLEPVTVPHWVRGEETASLVEWAGRPAGDAQHLVVTALGGSVATPPGGITARVVVVHDRAELERLGTAVRGAIVLFDVAFDQRLAAAGEGGAAYGALVGYRSGGPSAAAKLGAVGSLVRSLGSAEYRLPHTGLTRYAAGVPKIPAGALTAEDADLVARLAERGPVTMRLTLTPRTLPDAATSNVVADLPGTAVPACTVIVSGHLDSWDLGTGATDDGAGVAEAMAATATLHELGVRPRCGVRFIAWANEENGVRGGTAYARDPAAAASTVAAIESDSGAARPLGFATSLSAASAPVLGPIADVLAGLGAPAVTYGAGSETDVGPLAALGVPVFAPVQRDPRYFDYHHTAADTFDKVDPRGIAENAAVLATLAYGLAATAVPLAREPYADDR